MSMTLAQLVSIESSGSSADAGADKSALLTVRQGADSRARSSRPGHRQLVTMLLPKSSGMAAMASGLRRGERPRRKNQYQYY
jgi:hypothetical protein